MRKSYVARCVTAAALGASAFAFIAPAAEARELVTFTPFTIPANRCGFPIDVRVWADNEFEDVVTLPDGTTVTHTTGRLVLSFTNTATGSSIVRNVSGPSTETDHPDGTGTFVGEGLSWFAFGPHSQANTGEPCLLFTSGLVVLQFANGAVTDFSLDGEQINGCALLAG